MWRYRFFVTHLLCPYYRFLWGKCKDLQRKGRISQVFLSWNCCDNKSHWKQSSNQDPSWKRPNGIPGMPPGFCVKGYFSFFNFAINIVNFRLYANPWQTLGAASWQTTASSFWITWLYKPCLYSQCAYWLLPLGLVYYIHSLLGLSVVLGLSLISAFFYYFQFLFFLNR